MNLRRFYRGLLIGLALMLLGVVLFAAFASAVHAASCHQEWCVPCLGLARLQENIFQLDEFFGVVGFLTLLGLLQFAGSGLLNTQYALSLVSLKARLNN